MEDDLKSEIHTRQLDNETAFCLQEFVLLELRFAHFWPLTCPNQPDNSSKPTFPVSIRCEPLPFCQSSRLDLLYEDPQLPLVFTLQTDHGEPQAAVPSFGQDHSLQVTTQRRLVDHSGESRTVGVR